MTGSNCVHRLSDDIDDVTLGSDSDYVTEQCFEYNECSAYSTFTNADMAIFGVEYATNQLPSNFCPKAQDQGMSWLKKKLDL